jgi:hypothetical protein
MSYWARTRRRREQDGAIQVWSAGGAEDGDEDGIRRKTVLGVPKKQEVAMCILSVE